MPRGAKKPAAVPSKRARVQAAQVSPRVGFKEPARAPADIPRAVAEAPRNSRDVLQPHRNMALMTEDELRRYAIQIGVPKRDAENLGVDRLRQNCTFVLHQHIENLSA